VQNEVEIVNIRLRAWIRARNAKVRPLQSPRRGGAVAGTTQMVFDGKKQNARIYERTSLRAGKPIVGPAIISEYSGTTVVPPDWRASLDRADNLVLSQKKKRAT
jgi:N-methylhydantoinase A